MKKTPAPSVLLAIAAAAGALVISGCGAGEHTTAAASEGGGEAAAFAEDAAAAVEAATALQTPDTNPVPTDAPQLAPGKKIVIIPCAAAVEGCARPARSTEEAAERVGWDATIVDPAGAGGPSAAIQRAVSSGADAIVLNSIDAAAVKGDLEAARAKDIAVVCDMCGDTGGLIQAVVPPLAENERAGYLLGQQAFVLAKERFDAPPRFIVMSDNEFATVNARVAGVKKFIEDCKAAGAGCELVAEGQYLASEISTTAPGRVVSLVQSHPDYNVLFAGYDASLNFFAQGLKQAGLADPEKAFGLSIDADVANTEMIRSGGYQAASAGVPMQRVGYALVDTLNRLFNGEDVVDQGITVKIINHENAPESGSWDGDFDATPDYLKAWGIS